MDPLSAETPSDTPIPDQIWDGLGAWMRGTFAEIGVALAVSATLGWPRPAAAMLTGVQLALLVSHAVASGVVIVQSGRRLSRRPLGGNGSSRRTGDLGSLLDLPPPPALRHWSA
jgi:hypothetical protein